MEKKDILKVLKERLAQNEKNLDSWLKVQRAYKKDGTEFKVLSKNFTNLRMADELENRHPIIKPIASSWEYYGIQVYGYCDEMKDKTDPRYTPNHSCLRSTYIYTVEEIVEAIEEEKARIKEAIASYKKQLADFDKVIKKADGLIKKVQDFYKSEEFQGGLYTNTLGYRVREYIAENVKY